jgi:hypothetical protein
MYFERLQQGEEKWAKYLKLQSLYLWRVNFRATVNENLIGRKG